MKKKYIVKSNKEFENIIVTGNQVKNKLFIIYYQKNNKDITRYGISVGKKLGNAVYRNKYKRKIRAIIDNNKNVCLNGYDYIIILRGSANNPNYKDLNDAYIALNKYIRKDNNNE